MTVATHGRAGRLPAGYAAALPRAAETVGARLLGALCREGIGAARDRWGAQGRRHGFGRVEFAQLPVGVTPAALLAGVPGGAGLLAEVENAIGNQAIAYARLGRGAQAAGVDAAVIGWERLAVSGHNLHPCGRTRLGWDTADVLEHDLEGPGTAVGFVAVRADLASGDDVGAVLADRYWLPHAPAGYRLQPVHVWQRDVLLHRYADEVHAGLLRPVDGLVPAIPTMSIRTVLLPEVDGVATYLKLSLDVQITSSRRTISVASARNGPVVSAALARLLAADELGERVLLLPEVAGAGVPGLGGGRDLSAIVRDGLAGRLVDGERVLPAAALPAVAADGRPLLASVVEEFAVGGGWQSRGAAAGAFLRAYAGLLLGVVLPLAVRYGIGLEAHLQNCLPTFRAGVPYRLGLRDFAGLRLHGPRLAAAGVVLPLWPGSVIAGDDVTVMRAKVGYTALQAHLSELVICLGDTQGLDEAVAWAVVRDVFDEVMAPLLADPVTAAAARDDAAAWTAPLVAHKALVRMRLLGGGDRYVEVPNPLHRRTDG